MGGIKALVVARHNGWGRLTDGSRSASAAAIASDAPEQGTVRGLHIVIDLLLALMLFAYGRALVRVSR